MRRGVSRIVVALFFGCAALVGCGPLGGGDDDPTTGAQKVVDQFAEAINNDDFDTVCGLLDSNAIRSIEKGATGTCAKSLAADSRQTTADLKVVVDEVRTSQERGTADITVRILSPEAGHKVLTSKPQSLLLVMEDGEWRLASPI